MSSLGRLLLAFAAVLCSAALLPALASAAPTGAIEGTVTDAVTHGGVEGVEACATRYEPTFVESCELTAADGSYAIEGLPAGEYEVGFYARAVGYSTTFYPGLVAVGTEPVTGIDAELFPISRIAGTVTRSSDGEPVEEVLVCARESGSGFFVECTETGFDGSYALEELEPGGYVVEFWSGYTGQNLAYQFFDGRNHFPEADVVSLEEGESVTGVDAELGPGATISGHVYSAATGAALEEIYVCAFDVAGDELAVCNLTEPDGGYELPILPAGQYKVIFSIDFEEWFEEEEGFEEDDGFATQFWNNQTTLAAANEISVSTGQTVSGIDARLGPSSSPAVQPPAVVTPAARPTAKRVRHKHCRRGFKRKKVKGKYRCVKRKKHRHHRRHAAASRPFSASRDGLVLRPGPVSRPLVRSAR